MDYQRFYRKLFAPLEAALGPLEDNTLMPLIGFDAGGPLSFSVFRQAMDDSLSYVSCELAVRVEQKPCEFGRYELLVTSDDERWVRTTLSSIARESFDSVFGAGHTLDIGAWATPDVAIQGVVLELASTAQIDGASYAVLRCIGVTRSELEFALDEGVLSLLDALREAGVYPRTLTRRASIV